MKPVFKKERELLESKLNMKLPEHIWIHGQSLYLNADVKTRFLTFKTLNRKDLVIKKNCLDAILSKYKNKSYEEEILESKERLDALESESISMTESFIKKHPGYKLRPSGSGGKDSDVMLTIVKKAFKNLNITDYTIDFMNSTNETAQTYLHIKNNYDKDKLRINNPKKGMFDWLVEDKDYYIPTVVSRICCSTYKEGEIKKVLDKNENYIIFLGVRKDESPDRSLYDWDLNKKMNELYKKTGKSKYKLNVPQNWKRFLPIVNWTDKDVWLYILRENIPYNKQYEIGFNRCGCTVCCYMSDYAELLVKEFYPLTSQRWDKILETHYEVKDVSRRLKYTKDEFINQGKWKLGIGKEYEIITKKATPERIKELAELKGCSIETASKFFNRKCSCGEKINHEEVGMFLKYFGRYENSAKINDLERQLSFFQDEVVNQNSDTRKYLCKNCFCKTLGIPTEVYEQKIRDFRASGCTLF